MIERFANSAGGPDGRQESPGFAAAGPAAIRRTRRITADSFRTLTARLKGDETPPVSALAESPPQQIAPPPVPDAAAPAAVFVPPFEEAVIPEAPALEALSDVVLPVFAPIEPFLPDPVLEEPIADPLSASAAEPAAEIVADMELLPLLPEPVAATEPATWELLPENPAGPVGDDLSAPAADAEVVHLAAEESAASNPIEAVVVQSRSEAPKSVKAASPLAEKVADAMLKTVTDAIYARPSAAERAAYLREVAAQIEQEHEATQAAPALAAASIAVAHQADPIGIASRSNDAATSPPPPFVDSLADRLGPAAPLLRKPSDAPDPFSKTAADAIRLDPKPRETPEADEDSGELALSLLDMMSAGSGSAQPQERALAADTLLRLVQRVPVRPLMTVVERVAIMEDPPALLVARLIRDPRAEVVAPLLERCMHITDQDLMTAAGEGDVAKRRMIARRRIISPVLADHLITIGDPSVLLTLIRNPGASFSHEAFYRLAEQASRHVALLAPLATRADLPAPVAFELFWFLPQELRRFIFSRFLTDSENLNKILKITLAAQDSGEPRFPSREVLEDMLGHAARADVEEAAKVLAEIAGVSHDTALRILSDRDGEPLTVALKALGYPRSNFSGAMEVLKHFDCQLLHTERNVGELQSIFDKLSFNKARRLLTYWDWFVQKTGPYAPHN